MAVPGLVGDWRLRSLTFGTTGGERQADLYGADPVGFLTIGGSGRMMAIITARDRGADDAAGLFKA